MKRAYLAATHATALFVLALFSLRLWRNLRFLRFARAHARLPAAPPRVSVLVPARNEARTIATCVESLVTQSYPDFEVIVLDDQSDDGTGALLDGLAARCPNLTVMRGTETPPAGWNGKSYACARLAEQARGAWLLFTDADTRHTPTGITQGIAQAEALGVHLLSAFPRQVTGTWGERVLVTFIVDFLPLVGVDLTRLWRGAPESGDTAANGQYLLVRADTYRALGGHGAIAGALVDDFALAQRVRSSGFPIAFVDGTSMLECRMYHDAREVWDGFSKNLMLALSMSSARQRRVWWSAALAWGYGCLFVMPFVLLFASRDKRLPLLPVLEIGWLAALRAAVVVRFSRPVAEVVTTPLAAWGVMALGLNAVIRRRRGGAVRWKGREYSA